MITRVVNNSAVLMHVILTLADGSQAESTRALGKPTLFRLGDGSLSPELEQQLLGLQVGDKRVFTLPPTAAFGAINPDLLQFFSHHDFSETGVPDVGTIMLFTTMDGRELTGVVREVMEASVTVDFNHPLSGQAITFDIEILEIVPSNERKV